MSTPTSRRSSTTRKKTPTGGTSPPRVPARTSSLLRPPPVQPDTSSLRPPPVQPRTSSLRPPSVAPRTSSLLQNRPASPSPFVRATPRISGPGAGGRPGPGQLKTKRDEVALGLERLDPSKEARAKAALKASIGGDDHKACAKKLAKRFPHGPLFTATDVANIDELAKYPEGMKWLDAVGIGSVTTARDYLQKKNYKDWLTLEPGKRLLIAAIAWDQKVGANDESPPPSFTLGRAMAIEQGEEKKKAGSLTQQEATDLAQAKKDRDAHIRKAFVNTMMPVSQTDEASVRGKQSSQQEGDDVLKHNLQTQQILTRTLLILQAGLQVYDDGAGKHVDYATDDVVRALAHGGRVNIRIPARSAINYNDDANALMNWIGLTRNGNEVDAVKSRGFGTHHMNIGENKPTEKGSGTFKEEGGKSASLTNKFSSGVDLYGVDLAAGGLGKKDFNGDVIMPDGGHGHMFVGFTKPTRTRDGALQIGIETTGPGAESLVGYKHTWQSTEATANPESSFYGHKMQKVGEGKLSKNQRLVDLNEIQKRYGSNWITKLDELANEWDRYVATATTQGNERAAYERLAGQRQFVGSAGLSF